MRPLQDPHPLREVVHDRAVAEGAGGASQEVLAWGEVQVEAVHARRRAGQRIKSQVFN